MRQAAALVRALAATSGAAALRRGLPVYAGLFAAVGLLFGGNGLQATTVVAGADASTLARALLWAGWLVISGSTVEALWRCPPGYWLRSLPVPRAWHLGLLLGMTALAHAPWAVLWAAGGGSGLGALGGAMAMHALVLARPVGLPGIGLVIVGAAGLVLAPGWSLALGTWPIVLVGFRRAWIEAPVRAASRARLPSFGARPLALLLVALAGLWRGHPSVLLRGGLLCGLAAAAAWLAAWNNELVELPARLGLACGFLAPAALASGSAASGPMLVAEARADWLLRTAGASARTRLAAFTLATASVGAGLGLLAGAGLVTAWGGGPGPAARVLATLTLAGGALAALAGLAARRAATRGTRGPGRLIATLLATCVAVLAALAWFGGWAPALWAAAAVVTWLLGHVLTDRDEARGGATVLLEMIGVRKRLGSRVILEDATLRCDGGELALVLGANGAGKSTLLRIAAGIVAPDRGEVRVGGAAVADVAGRMRLGYAPDTADAFPELSVRELIALVGALKRAAPPPAELRTRLGLDEIWHQRLRTLSFGQVKRAYLLAAWIGPPALLILDEPSNGLDPAGAEMVAELLRERAAAGGAALVATNDAAFAGLLAGTQRRILEGRLVLV